MKKVANILIVVGSALAAIGFLGWRLIGINSMCPYTVSGQELCDQAHGWVEVIGVGLIVCGVLLFRDLK